MSAWQIGANPPAPKPGGSGLRDETAGPHQGTQEFVDRLTKWIPGDAIAIYVTGVTALAARAHSKPSIVFLVAVAILTPALVLGGAWSKGTPIKLPTWVS